AGGSAASPDSAHHSIVRLSQPRPFAGAASKSATRTAVTGTGRGSAGHHDEGEVDRGELLDGDPVGGLAVGGEDGRPAVALLHLDHVVAEGDRGEVEVAMAVGVGDVVGGLG